MPFIEIQKTITRRIFASDGEPIKPKVPRGYSVIAVDDKNAIGTCEGCGEPICEGEEYDAWEDGVITHKHECCSIQPQA